MQKAKTFGASEPPVNHATSVTSTVTTTNLKRTYGPAKGYRSHATMPAQQIVKLDDSRVVVGPTPDIPTSRARGYEKSMEHKLI